MAAAVMIAAAFGVWCCERPASEYQPFFELSISEQKKSLRRYPLPQQIDIYLHGTTKMAPPFICLADPLARNGKKAVPQLLERLSATGDDAVRAHLFYVFERMACLVPGVRGDQTLISRLRAEVDPIDSEQWRRRARLSLATLKERLNCIGGTPESVDSARSI